MSFRSSRVTRSGSSDGTATENLDIVKRSKQFRQAKQQCLGKEDLSRKGSIDEPIRPLVDLFNTNNNYYTTSTCSGRISLIEKPQDNPAIKKGGNFLLNSHEGINFDEFYRIIKQFADKNDDTSCLWLKFEPFIMHVQCYNLDAAYSLVSTALAAGCRNSGITLGKREKFLVAIRSTSSMEIPLHCGSKFLLDTNYLRFLSDECNRRLKENLQKLDKFAVDVKQMLSNDQSSATEERNHKSQVPS